MAFLDFIPAIADGVAGIFGLGSTAVTNSANREIARETNAQNYKIFQEQLGWQEKMWNQNNAYNTPLEQRKRLEEAGINPYLALSNMSTGEATMATSPSAPQMQTGAPMQAPDFSFIGRSAQNFQDYRIKEQQVTALQEANRQSAVKSRFATAQELADLRLKLADLRKKQQETKNGSEEFKRIQADIRRMNWQTKQLELEYDYSEGYLQARNAKEMNLANLAYHQQVGQALQNEYQQMYNTVFPGLTQAQVNLLAAQTYAQYQSGNLSKNMSNTEFQKAIGAMLDNSLKRGEIKLQQFGMSKAEFEALKAGKLLDSYATSDFGLRFFNVMDWIKSMMPTLIAPIK